MRKPKTESLLLDALIIEGENPKQFQSIIEGARTQFQPANPFEQMIVDLLAAALWRKARLAALESRILEMEQKTLPDFVRSVYQGLTLQGRAGLAVMPLARKFNQLATLSNVITRNFRDLFKTFCEIRKHFPPQPAV